jgi:parvulin-like peptidyl-prolyl isomerase
MRMPSIAQMLHLGDRQAPECRSYTGVLALLFLVAAAIPNVASAQTAPRPSPRPSAPKAAAIATPNLPTGPASQLGHGDIVAQIGGIDVTAEEIRSFISGLGVREQVAIRKDPALLAQAVRILLANRLVLKEALAKKWEDQPTFVAQLKQLRDNAITETYLQSISVPANTFPTADEVEKAYEANKTAFVVPRQFQIAQVFVALAKDADKAAEDTAKKKVADVQAKLKQPGADFAAIATSSSDDHETGPKGGDLGWVLETQIRPEIKSQLLGLAKNAMTDAIRMDDGWHVVKLVDTKASYTRPLSEVHDALVERLRAQQADANRRGYVANLVKNNPPAINEIALTKVFGELTQEAAGK